MPTRREMVAATLRELGFDTSLAGSFVRRERRVELEGSWLVVRKRRIRRPVFEVPLDAVVDAIDELTEAEAIETLVGWALGRRTGGGSFAPSPERLSVRAGSFMQQVRVDGGPTHYRLVIDLAAIPSDLPAPRRRWLEAFLERSGLRFVRVATTEDRVEAAVDLSGAPETLLPALVRVGVDALRLAYRTLVLPASIVTDPASPTRLLEHMPENSPYLSKEYIAS